MNQWHHRAFSRCDLAVVLCCVVLVSAVTAVAFNQPDKEQPVSPRTVSARAKDATQMRGIHQSFIVHARESKGMFPTPGLIRRLPHNGQFVPGRGEEDTTQNTTANLYSAMIMMNFFTPELVVSPLERSPRVKAYDECDEYDYTRYDVTKGIYWDEGFKADLSELSHASYAHMPMTGPRHTKHWRDTMDSNFSVIGARGPKDGVGDHTSITCGPYGNWAGNIVRHDNAAPLLTSTLWERVDETGMTIQDNLFAAEGNFDVILAFTRAMSPVGGKGPELQFD